MASNASLAGTSEYAATHVTERSARTLPGLRMLTLALAILTAGIVVLWLAGRESGDARTALIWLGVILLAAALLLLGGLTPVTPGRARVVQLFGKYRGTIRETGLQWVNPFTRRIAVKLSVLRTGNRAGHAAPAAGQRGRRRAAAHRRGCGGHGSAGPAAAGGRGRRRAG